MKLTTMTWYYAYELLASGISLFYKDNNGLSVGEKLYNLLSADREFIEENKWFKKFIDGNSIKSIDPLHIFASISPNNITDARRTKRLRKFLEILGIELDTVGNSIDYIDFDGCPAPPQIHSLAIRNNENQNQIWDTFDDIYGKGNKCDLNTVFRLSKNWYGFSIRLLTIYLFWIRSDSFLPLDRNTIALLKKNKRLVKDPRNSNEYSSLLLGREKTELYRNISLVSYDPDIYENLNSNEKDELNIYLGNDKNSVLDVKKKQFRLLAIRPVEGCDPRLSKSLRQGVLYKLYNKFEELEDKLRITDSHDLFSTNDFTINVEAIVGKNGTGKSAIVELFIAASNNVAIKFFESEKHKGSQSHQLEWIKDLNVELYYETDHVYKLIISNNDLEVIKYEEKAEGEYKELTNFGFDDFSLDSFYYTALVNYSLHGLNASHQDDWLEPIFHKNDGYQTPVVIEPYRTNGVIDVNLQDDLVKQRLLHNLLILDDEEDVGNSYKILKRGNNEDFEAKYFTLSLNPRKTKTLMNQRSKTKKMQWEKLIRKLFIEFECPCPVNFFVARRSENDNYFVLGYLMRKLDSITKTYLEYKKYYSDKSNRIIHIDSYVKSLRQDVSHRTTKLRQAINFLKFGLYNKKNWGKLWVEDSSRYIAELLSGSNSAIDVLPEDKLDFLLPPAFFTISIYLENDVEFSKLSSGEKQIVFSISSLMYHLRNVDSVQANEGALKYSHFNIFLDEIELCLHPELQRIYFQELRRKLIQFKNQSTYISGVNICFVTHSPFVLSDMPSDSVLFLNYDHGDELHTIPDNKNIKTFAANIHDLLSDGFFVDSTIGEFAESCIKEIVIFNGKVRASIDSNNGDYECLVDDYKNLKPRFEYICSISADEYIKNILSNHLMEIEEILKIETKEDFISERIKNLELEIEELKREKYNAKT